METKSIYDVCVIGAGLAGSECAYQLASFSLNVAVVEMRPVKMTPAHHTSQPAELVCSNSLRSQDPLNAVGLLKEEMHQLGSLIMRAAYHAKVPAGSALAVDREIFSNFVKNELSQKTNISFLTEEVLSLEHEKEFMRVVFASGNSILARRCVISSGPLTSDALASWISKQTQQDYLYFYDSIAPIVQADSIDMTKAFLGSRYQKGDEEEGDYINCPLTEEQYQNFIQNIKQAELIAVKDFDKAQFFEGCLPIEEMVRRGDKTLQFGPLKPVGLVNPHEPDVQYAAVIQLRQDNKHASLYNMVGFQTRMKWPEQKRIFTQIPGLENAEFIRFGSMHRNTYICSPLLLNSAFELQNFSGVHFAGQITGCEGYVESAAVGQFVGLTLASFFKTGSFLKVFSACTAWGALLNHILQADPKNYQPMNVNFGLFEALQEKCRKKDRKEKIVKRARDSFLNCIAEVRKYQT